VAQGEFVRRDDRENSDDEKKNDEEVLQPPPTKQLQPSLDVLFGTVSLIQDGGQMQR
jgi:hypothetical protein